MLRELLAKRVQSFGSSIFTEISALAVEHGAINLGQGFPDFPGPAWVKQAAADAIAADLNQYPPASGLPQLKRAVANHWARSGWRELDAASEVTVTSGATEALCGALLALVNPGDEVILFEPAYDAYGPDVMLAGGVAKYVRLHPPTHGEAHYQSASSWWFDPGELAAAFGPRTRAIVVNTPHNPTGKVFSRAELELIGALCQEHNVVALADEVYDQIVFDGVVHVPLATLPGMWERTLTINSIGKTFSVTGWKVGYGVGPANLSHALRQAHQWVTFSTATPLQQAAAVALERAAQEGYYDVLRAAYQQRRDMLAQLLGEVGMPTLPIQGSYFLMADISGSGYSDDVSFCRWLTTEIGVAAIPPSVLYSRQEELPLLARFCFAKSFDTLGAAGKRLLGALSAQRSQT